MITIEQTDFPALRDEWLALEEGGHVPTVFQTYDWMDSWWKHLGFRGRKLILAAREDGDLIGIAPIYVSRMTVKGVPLFNVARLIGHGESDYNAFILKKGHEGPALKALLRHLRPFKWDIFWLSDVHSETATNSLVTGILKELGYHYYSQRHTPCPYIKLPGSYEDYLRGLSGSVRRNTLNYARRLEKAGVLNLSKTKREHCNEDMRYFFMLHEKRWKYNWLEGALNGKALKQFHVEASARLSRYLSLHFLELNGKRIACEYSYDFNGVVFNYLRGMDMEYRHYRPGNIILLKLIERAINAGMVEIDFMRGDEEYKFHFTKTSRQNMKYLFSGSSLKLKTFKIIENMGTKK